MLVPAVPQIKRQWVAVAPKSQFAFLNEGQGLADVWLGHR
jgi:hypothetical protein